MAKLRKLSPEEIKAAGIDPATLPPVEDAPANPEPQAGPPGALTSIARGAGQGVTLGFADELTGAAKAALKPFPDDLNANPWAAQQKTYEQGRDEYRRDDLLAQKSNPKAFAGGELVGSVLTPVPMGKANAATRLGRTFQRLVQGGAIGTVIGAGKSDADLARSPADVATDTAIGTATGAVANSVLGPVFDKLGNYFTGKAGAARQEVVDAAQKKADQAFASARGKLGGEVSAGSRTTEVVRGAANDPAVSAAAQARAAQAEADPAFQALREQVVDGSTGRVSDQLARIGSAKGQLVAADTARQAPAVAAEAQKVLDKPMAGWARYMKTYAPRVLPSVVAGGLGTAIGGPEGAALGMGAGALLGASLGRPGTALSNAVNNPAWRAAAWNAMNKVARLPGNALGRYASIFVSDKRNENEKLAMHEALLERDPEYARIVTSVMEEP